MTSLIILLINDGDRKFKLILYVYWYRIGRTLKTVK